MSGLVPGGRRITVLVVDDHGLFRKGLAALLGRRGITVLGEASDGRAGIEQACALDPDVVLMDVDMPACNGIEATGAILDRMPDARVLLLTVADDEWHAFSAIKAGAGGSVRKTAPPDELFDAIDRVMRGEPVIPRHMAARVLDEFSAMAKGAPRVHPGAQALTRREEEILCHLVDGASNEELGVALDLSEQTVATHLRTILEKLRLSNRTPGPFYVQRRGLEVAAPSH